MISCELLVFFFIKYSSNSKISTEKVYKYNSGKPNRERYIKYGMYEYGESKSIKNSLYVGENFFERSISNICSRKIQSNNNTTDYMGHKRKNRAKCSGCENLRAPKTILISHILDIKNIFYETESKCDEYRKKHSFFYRINRRKRTGKNTKMFTCFFYNGYYYIIKKHELKSSKYCSRNSNSSVCKSVIKYIEL